MQGCFDQEDEKKLKYQWPVWFAEEPENSFFQGQMVDVSSEEATFICRCDEIRSQEKGNLVIQLSVPTPEKNGYLKMTTLMRTAQVKQVKELNSYLCRITISFTEPLPFKPGEQDQGLADQKQPKKTASSN